MSRAALRPLAVGLLLLPAALTAPSTVRARLDEVRAQRSAAGGIRAMPRLPRDGAALVLLAERVIPNRATWSWYPGGAYLAQPALVRRQRAFAETRLSRYLAFRLAPRVLVSGTAAAYAIVADATPASLGVQGRRSFRAGRFWVVER